MFGATTWGDLTTDQQEALIRRYYGVDEPETSVQELIEEFRLPVARNGVPEFLPGLACDERCEMCRGPLEFVALNRTTCREHGLALALVNPLEREPFVFFALPGTRVRIPYRPGRTKPCGRCLHQAGRTAGCRCARCKARYKQESRRQRRQQQVSWDAQRDKREQEERARRAERIARRRALEELGRALPTTELAPEVRRLAVALIAMCGSAEDDGGLWVTLDRDDDPWMDEPRNAQLLMAHLQVAGIARGVGPEIRVLTDPERGWSEQLVTRFLITISPDEAAQMRLISPALLQEWKQWRAAFKTH